MAIIIDNTDHLPAMLDELLTIFDAAQQVIAVTLAREPGVYTLRLQNTTGHTTCFFRDYKLWCNNQSKERYIIEQLNKIGEDFQEAAKRAAENKVHYPIGAMVPGKKLGRTGYTSHCEPVPLETIMNEQQEKKELPDAGRKKIDSNAVKRRGIDGDVGHGGGLEEPPDSVDERHGDGDQDG